MAELTTPGLFDVGDPPADPKKKRLYPDGVAPKDSWKLRDAKGYLRERLDEGVHCPCCNQLAQRYKRKLNSGMALALVFMSRAPAGEFLHVPQFLAGLAIPRALKAAIGGGGDYAKLIYWGLIEQESPTVNSARRKGGRYRVTEKGRKFVAGRIEVYKYVLVYDGKQYRCDDTTTVDIRGALGSKFDLDELTRGVA